MHKNTVVLSVGGSLIAPDGVNVDFLEELRDFILERTRNGEQFVIVCGGGGTARTYQKAARTLKISDQSELDWIGIHATRLNAQLVKALFGNNAHPNIITDPTQKINFKESVLIGAGWKPGWSTDYVAILLAEKLHAKRVINLTNVDYVYDKNPNEHTDAQPLKELSWKQFQELFGTEWQPGLHAPFDPIAGAKAQELNMEVAIINGAHLDRIATYLDTKISVGTLIQ